MAQFIRSVLLFIAPVILGWCALIIFIDGSVQHEKEGFTLASDTETLLMGDSHGAVAFNDSLISHSKSLTRNSESLYHTAHKLPGILSNNPHIRRIILAVGYHSFSSYYDPISFNQENANQYFLAMPRSEQWKRLKSFDFSLFEILRAVQFQTVRRLREDDAGWKGGFSPENYRKPSSEILQKRIELQFPMVSGEATFSELNTTSFRDIVHICKQHKVDLIVVNTPLEPTFRSLLPKEYRRYYHRLMHETGVTLLNLEDLALTAEDYLPDGDHVSLTGSHTVSACIAGYLYNLEDHARKL